MKDFVIQYFDENGDLKVAHVRAYTKDEAVEKFCDILEKEGE